MVYTKRQIFTSFRHKLECICVTLFSNKIKEQKRLKIDENLSTASLDPKLTGCYKSVLCLQPRLSMVHSDTNF